MKRQLDRLKGKRLVTGNPNLMTKNEIYINTTPNGVEVKEIGIDGKIKDLAGSGGGNAPGGRGLEYLDLRGYDPINDRAIAGVIGVSLLWNALNNGVSLIGPVAMITSVIKGNLEKLLACAVDFSVSLSIGPSGILTAKDFLLQSGVSEEAIASIPRLTTEEFYNLNSSDNSGDSTVKEGDLLYYTISDVSLNSIRDITDNITQIAVVRGENTSTASIIYLEKFVDIQDVTIEKGDDHVVMYTSDYNIIDMPAFVYKVGSDLKTAEDIVGNSSITRITKDEYDDIFCA